MKLYSNIKTKNTYFEVWGGSTKHPDVRRVLQQDIEDERFTPPWIINTAEYTFFQWTLQCISDLSFGTYHMSIDFLEMCGAYFKENDCWLY